MELSQNQENYQSEGRALTFRACSIPRCMCINPLPSELAQYPGVCVYIPYLQSLHSTQVYVYISPTFRACTVPRCVCINPLHSEPAQYPSVCVCINTSRACPVPKYVCKNPSPYEFAQYPGVCVKIPHLMSLPCTQVCLY